MKQQRIQLGIYTIEFAIVSVVFFLFLLSIVEFGKVLYFYNAAIQATREAARLGAVCTMDTTKIKSKVTQLLPFTTNSNIEVIYKPDKCTVENCKTITVSLVDAKYTAAIFSGIEIKMPKLSTTLPRESLDSKYNANCS